MVEDGLGALHRHRDFDTGMNTGGRYSVRLQRVRPLKRLTVNAMERLYCNNSQNPVLQSSGRGLYRKVQIN